MAVDLLQLGATVISSSQWQLQGLPTCHSCGQNKNLDISINASNNFNLNITWSIGSTAELISREEILCAFSKKS
uniref:Uncharacterized protein n=1 Tax=Sphaerodactylus townsendi TaxID=933632 RepID=A0ACB8F9G6_9SAUR